MNSRETFSNILRGIPTDRIAIHENFWADTLTQWVKNGYPTTSDPSAALLIDRFDASADIPVSPIDFFGIDDWKITGWLDCFPHIGFHQTVDESDDWLIWKNGAGAIVREFKHKTGVQEHIDFTMTSREIWEAEYKPLLLAPADMRRIDLQRVRAQYERARKSDRCVFYCTEFIWETMRRSMGDICMYTSFLDDPEWILDFNQTYTEFFMKHFELLFDAVGLPDGGWIFEDIAYSRGLFCSPEVLSELFFPFYKNLADFFHSYKLPIVFHSCGKVEDAIPMIVEAGYDALNPLEAKAIGDALRIADKFGSQIALIGGFDARIFEEGNKSKIEQEMLRLINGMKARGARYVFSSDHSVSPRVSLETYAFAVDVFKRNMKL